MRILLAGILALAAFGSSVRADKAAPIARPAIQDLGKWDCHGSPTTTVLVTPGEHVYAWHGECSGAEGFDIVIEPQPKQLETRMSYDAKTKVLELRVRNSGPSLTVKLHVFVGFA
ncbi:MAG: hypothetical protein H6Q90_1457 [Deltaproteobacteria bacterium]|nr:hypothetical protein [Deltaproteobacteria bacterium]